MDKNIRLKLALHLRKLRQKAGWTQEKLAEGASLSKNYIGNIERGEYDVSVSVLKRVAVALGCRATDLLAAADI